MDATLLIFVDIALIRSSAEDLQKMLEELAEASLQVGLEMNVDKTKVMSQKRFICR